MESDPLPVVARELGNNISRIKILKPETRTIKRRGKEESTVVEGIIEVEGSSAEDLSLLAEEAYILRESEGDVEDCSMAIQCDTHLDLLNDSEPDSLSSSMSSTSTSTSTSTSSSASFRRGKDSSSGSVVTECSGGTDSEGRSVKTEGGSDLSDAISITEDTIVYFENEKKEKEKEEKKFKKEELKNILLSDADPAPSDSVPKGEKNKPSHKEANASHVYMDPNEPVYMGSKTYGKLFVFWQVGTGIDG